MDASTFCTSPSAPGHRAWVHRTFRLSAAVMASALLITYVQVCLDTVARGERWRAEQRTLNEPRADLRQKSAGS